LSKKYHPDINPDEAAHEKFIEVSRGGWGLSSYASRAPADRLPAYEILSEEEVSAFLRLGVGYELPGASLPG
jgi:hypothetical protein